MKQTECFLAIRPPVDSLLNPGQDSFWRKSVLDDSWLRKYAEWRRLAIDDLDSLFRRIPNPSMSLQKAVAAGLVTEIEAASAYQRLAFYLHAEPWSDRLVLYLPFELLPERDWKPTEIKLAAAASRFRDSYLRAWHELLSCEDTRANFVDGDIPEAEMRTGPLPRVVKAAHFIPILIAKGFISREEAEFIRDSADNLTLRKSAMEAIDCIGNDPKPSEHYDSTRLSERLALAREEIKESQDSHLYFGKPKTRIAWEMKRDKAAAIRRAAKDISLLLKAGTISADAFLQNLGQEDADMTMIGILVAQMATETAPDLFPSFKPFLAACLTDADQETADAAESAFFRLVAGGVAEADILSTLGLQMPDLEGGVALGSIEVDEYSSIAQAIAHSEAGAYVLPVAIAYGSRIKGYGSRTADLDTAIFVKPGVPYEHRAAIQKLLKETLEPLGIGMPVDFWLESDERGLRIRDFPDPDRTQGDSTLVHVLFGSIWTGEESVLRRLFADVLERYLYANGSERILGQSARTVWLLEMERDILLYRLMHKGYARSNPERTSEFVPKSDALATNVSFWDPGYRRLASKLFLKKVFLPHISR
ncbi:MAG TPA: hypothetical protein VFT82_03040 [Candidatus Paceibacterota bacterium]|nr:hypothetical protein [Candidatus Paceibacterota bacterium]